MPWKLIHLCINIKTYKLLISKALTIQQDEDNNMKIRDDMESDIGMNDNQKEETIRWRRVPM